ncbi:MAG: zinc-ribbon domain-containing protein [Candidatus Heimdallarchaeota archaeon]|nr:zinc-ribbon domain-containing protein [Candidatus Heimdallarchaeota archaeon]
MRPRWRRILRMSRKARRRALRRNRRFIRRRTRRLLIGGAIILALAGTNRSYKMQERDVERLENHYGRPVEELTEEEIITGMRHLGIERIDLTSEDEARVYDLDREESGKSTTRYCPNCGKRIEPKDRFCAYCGKQL